MEETRLEKLEKEVAELRTQLGSKEKSKKEKKPRAPSAYNDFVKKSIAEEKSKMGEKYDHKKAFKNAAEMWSAKKGNST